MSKLSIAGETTSTARSQTARPSNRRVLLSAVPDSAELTPLRRPDQGGKAGQPVQIYTNHFRVTMDDAVINQYDIEISWIRRDGKLANSRKNERWQVLKQLAQREKNFPVVW